MREPGNSSSARRVGQSAGPNAGPADGRSDVDLWVAAALRGELSVLRSRLQAVRGSAMSSVVSRRGWPGGAGGGLIGSLGGARIGLCCFGVGAVRATQGAAWLSRRPGDAAGLHVVLVGLAGGLDPSLALQELVAVGEVRTADALGAEALALQPPGQQGGEGTGCRQGICVSAPQIVASTAEKSRLWRWTAGASAAVVDLESWAFCSELRRRAPSATVHDLRVVSDTADEDLPPWLGRCTDATGALSPARVAAAAVWRPTRWPDLARLRRSMLEGAEVLADAVGRLVR